MEKYRRSARVWIDRNAVKEFLGKRREFPFAVNTRNSSYVEQNEDHLYEVLLTMEFDPGENTFVSEVGSGCYIGRCRCGSIVAATVDRPDRRKEVAKDVADFIIGGLSVEWIETGSAGVTIQSCTCNASQA